MDDIPVIGKVQAENDQWLLMFNSVWELGMQQGSKTVLCYYDFCNFKHTAITYFWPMYIYRLILQFALK